MGERRGASSRRRAAVMAKFCPACGEELAQPTTECPHCGATILLRGEPLWTRVLRGLPPPTTLVPFVAIIVVCGGGYLLERYEGEAEAARPVAGIPQTEMIPAPEPTVLQETVPAESPIAAADAPVSTSNASPRESAPESAESGGPRPPKQATASKTVQAAPQASPPAPTLRRTAPAASTAGRLQSAVKKAKKRNPAPVTAARKAVPLYRAGPSFTQVRTAMRQVPATDSQAWSRAARQFIGKQVRWRGRVHSVEREDRAQCRVRVDLDPRSILSAWDVEALVAEVAARRLSPGDEVLLEGVIRSVDWSISGLSVELSRATVRKVS